ncbi:MAG: T9SS type A sorting domain-containing protein [Bacteroidetes bacterium]|nr:T9SS type A sorting domain-containing protein [Bacteroidota bacterium]
MIRKSLIGLIAALIISCSVHSQINVQWVGRYTSAGSNIDRAKSMVVDAAGNSFVVGTSWNGTNFDIVTVKFDANGIQQWTTPYNGPGNGYDEARQIRVDATGNIYVTGYSAGLAANYDIVTIKYNPLGVQQWATRYNGTASGFDEGYDLALDGSGNVYVCGGTKTTTSNANYVTLKYNSTGVQQWATVYSNTTSSTATETAYAICLDAANNVYVTGSSFGTTGTDNDIATIKYNNAGVQQWVSRYNGPGSVFDAGSDIVVDAAQNVFLTGYARDLIGTTNYSYVTIKINAAGTQQWASIYDGPSSDVDEATAITLTPSGNVAVTGHSIGTAQTAEDCATILYNGTNGNSIWIRRFDGGAVNYDEGTAIAADSSNRIFVTGFSYANASNNNFLTIKYEANGDTSWIVKYNGPGNNSDQAYAIAIGPTAEIYVAGMSKGLGTNEDYAVVKYCQLTASASNDTSICLGANVQLHAQSSYGAIDSVWWTPSTYLNQSNIANPIATPSSTISYVLHLRNQYGCIDVDTVNITVFPLPGPQIQTNGPASFCMGDSVMLTAVDTTNGIVTYLWNTGSTNQSITVDTTGTYTVTITNSIGCDGITSINVIANLPPIIFAGNDVGVCQSTSVALCATGGLTYAWTPSFGLSDTTIACPMAGPTSNTTYIVYGTDGNGCMGSDTVAVSLFPLPSVPIISRNIAVLTSTSATTYQWYFNSVLIPGATSQSYTPTQNGSYYVVTTDANGCQAFSSPYTMVDVGMNELSSSNLINLFPNPNNGIFTAEFDQKGMSATIEIYNVAGQKVFAKEIASNGISTTTFELLSDSGIYFVMITLEDGSTFSRRMVIDK